MRLRSNEYLFLWAVIIGVVPRIHADLGSGSGLRAIAAGRGLLVFRKVPVAYLIHVRNLSRETAKALLIDSASGWGGVRR